MLHTVNNIGVLVMGISDSKISYIDVPIVFEGVSVRQSQVSSASVSQSGMSQSFGGGGGMSFGGGGGMSESESPTGDAKPGEPTPFTQQSAESTIKLFENNLSSALTYALLPSGGTNSGSIQRQLGVTPGSIYDSLQVPFETNRQVYFSPPSYSQTRFTSAMYVSPNSPPQGNYDDVIVGYGG